MKVHLNLFEFHEKFGDLSREGFLEKFGDPFLIMEFLGEEEEEDPGDLGETLPAWERTSWEKDGVDSKLLALAVPLVKSHRDPDQTRISLGRATGNDIVVPHRSVSKFHAFIKTDGATGRFTLWDAGSTFGTTVNGETVLKGTPVLLENRISVVFAGFILVTYFTPEAFFEYLHTMAEDR